MSGHSAPDRMLPGRNDGEDCGDAMTDVKRLYLIAIWYGDKDEPYRDTIAFADEASRALYLDDAAARLPDITGAITRINPEMTRRVTLASAWAAESRGKDRLALSAQAVGLWIDTAYWAGAADIERVRYFNIYNVPDIAEARALYGITEVVATPGAAAAVAARVAG
jgi:hypothetical protein